MKFFAYLLLGFLTLGKIAQAQDELIVMHYNLLNYGNITDYCTASNNSMVNKEQYLRTIINYIKPDIFGVNELAANTYVVNRLLDSVMNYQSTKTYSRGNYLNAAGSDLISMVYYNNQKLALAQTISLQKHVRDIILYRLYYRSPNLPQTHDTVWINVISGHLKAGSTTSEQADRALMTANAITYLKNHHYPGNYIFMGDFNIQTSSETSYQNLISSTAGNFIFKDPIQQNGSWNNNNNFSDLHTQSTHSTSNGCASTGGMDDRFDFILVSSTIFQCLDRICYKTGSYKSVGNDGNHYNQSINSGTNNSVPASVLQALYNNSDHLPVVLTLDVSATVSSLSATSKPLPYKITNPVEEQLTIFFQTPIYDDIQIRIFGMDGKLISQTLESSKGPMLLMDLSRLSSGIFILEVQMTNHPAYRSKIIKL